METYNCLYFILENTSLRNMMMILSVFFHVLFDKSQAFVVLARRGRMHSFKNQTGPTVQPEKTRTGASAGFFSALDHMRS
jgi:hypothetical protein